MLATFTLKVPESKRLIAKGIAELSEVQQAMNGSKVIIAGGTTNGYIAEELVEDEFEKENYTAGIVDKGAACVTPSNKRINPVTLQNGKRTDQNWLEFMEHFTDKDIFIKGANAFDDKGVAGVLAGERKGGTIGRALGILVARGSSLLIPVGLEKRISSVEVASKMVGIDKVDYSLGMKTGLIPVTYGKIITELETLEILFGVEAIQIAAGGIGDSNGAVTLAIKGDETDIKKAMDLIKKIKGESKLKSNKRLCKDCPNPCNRIKG
ncbi:hypothetical protein [Selenihalanaerobacter shriftii]|uniref:Uncharacterized protein n=1 Tax=Selenihalanaerobacter shriftii TaxID=142842 RepID=A0A1T4JRY2_9FIRM|nr:hypothetical protein [Selenihalanaerobacter shriftii]SJZ32899.1 hypothetical protein SAMN02745118_00359 [Selenihalanaerobacter shriftii]